MRKLLTAFLLTVILAFSSPMLNAQNGDNPFYVTQEEYDELMSDLNSAMVRLDDLMGELQASNNQYTQMMLPTLEQMKQSFAIVKNTYDADLINESMNKYRAQAIAAGQSKSEVDAELQEMREDWEELIQQANTELTEGLDELEKSIDEMK